MDLMRLAWIAFALAACGSTPPPIDNASHPTAPAGAPATGAHDSRDALVRATFARVAAGDVDGLIELATKRPAYDRVLVCSGERPADEHDGLREALAPSAQSGSGLAIEVLSIELSTEDAPSTIAAGEKYEGTCTTNAPIVWSGLVVKLRIRKPTKPAHEVTAWLNVLDIGGRWYLAALQPQFE